jgi:hypothetical protein
MVVIDDSAPDFGLVIPGLGSELGPHLK